MKSIKKLCTSVLTDGSALKPSSYSSHRIPYYNLLRRKQDSADMNNLFSIPLVSSDAYVAR